LAATGPSPRLSWQPRALASLCSDPDCVCLEPGTLGTDHASVA